MINFSKILTDALRKEIAPLNIPELATITPDTDVFNRIDSLTIVNILLASEMMLEAASGRYVALADETLFDAAKSPLLKWSNWVTFVEAKHAEGS